MFFLTNKAKNLLYRTLQARVKTFSIELFITPSAKCIIYHPGKLFDPSFQKFLSLFFLDANIVKISEL